MKKFLFSDTPLGRFLNCGVNLVILNLLWVICSIPIITIGASTTALYYSVSTMSRGEEQMTKTFFKGFKMNFKQSTLFWGLTLLVGFLLYWGIYIVSFWENARSAVLMVFALPCLLFLMIISYAFPLLAEFETTIPRLLSNAILLSLGHFPRSLAIVAVNLLPFILIYIMPSWVVCAIFVWLPIGFALCAHIVYKLLKPVFAPFRPEEPDLSDV